MANSVGLFFVFASSLYHFVIEKISGVVVMFLVGGSFYILE